VRVLFATAEIAPVAQVGGLAVAAAGLVGSLRGLGIEVTVALPDYGGFDAPAAPAGPAPAGLAGASFVEREVVPLEVPVWAGPAFARRGVIAGVGPITLIKAHGSERPHPYVQADGTGWPDNDHRFFAFSAAVAALAELERPDVLHLNDWHTAATPAFLHPRPPIVLTIHNLAYQGWTNDGWRLGFPHHRELYAHHSGTNPLLGGIRLADLVVAVSPTYALEILTEAGGMGLADELAELGAQGRLAGILNGIDTRVWDPANDPALAVGYGWPDLEGKAADREALLEEMGLPETGLREPLLVVVSRLVEQKGIDLLLPLLPLLDRLPARLAVLGDGDQALAAQLLAAATLQPERVSFRRGYDDALAHRLFAGGDILLMPSRFEPCGLAQMQAMRYGTLPVVTDVGGLHDTVVDIDGHPMTGTGTVASEATTLALLDALHRGVRAYAQPSRCWGMQRRGMTADWSWDTPARQHIDHYERLVSEQGTALETVP
jgi:starch synthase